MIPLCHRHNIIKLNIKLPLRRTCFSNSLQGPLSRFGDTAANTGALALLEDADMPVMAKTLIASLSAGFFRIFLMPVDALKTILQV